MFSGFYWATVCKTVRPMLSDRFVCLVCPVLSACDIGVLWPDGWMDQGKTWYGGRRRRRPHRVRWGPSSLPQKRGTARPQPTIFVPCPLWPNGWMDQDATWYGDRPQPTPHCGTQLPPKRGTAQNFGPCLLWPNYWLN